MAKKAKRYSPEERKEILDFISSHGRGGWDAAVKKYRVTASTIAYWKRKAGELGGPTTSKRGAPSRELKILQDLTRIRSEIDIAEEKLQKLKARYRKATAIL